MSLYQRLLQPATLTALEVLAAENNTTGTTPDDDLDVLAALIVTAGGKRILHLGTFLGGSAIVLADLVGEGGKLVTLDPDARMNESCRKYTALAGLSERIETVDGSSTDKKLLARLGREWDAIYLDTTHQYQQTVAEIDTLAPLCSSRTLFLFHDASKHAADALDLGHQGGVRRAMREYCLVHPNWQWFVFEKPAFGQFGIGIMQKRVAP